MAPVILDNSIFFAQILREPLADLADALVIDLLERGDEIHAPVLLRYEQMSVLRRSAYFKKITEDVEKEALEWLQEFAIVVHYDESLLARSYAIAQELGFIVAYDSQYLALAERLECDFWTGDQRLIQAAKSTNLRVKWVGDFAPAK